MDDPKWSGSGYSPEKAWGKITQAEADREFERKHPLKWWEPIYFSVWGWLVILLLVGSAAGLFFWILSAPFA
jgi:hypothetical protein